MKEDAGPATLHPPTSPRRACIMDREVNPALLRPEFFEPLSLFIVVALS